MFSRASVLAAAFCSLAAAPAAWAQLPPRSPSTPAQPAPAPKLLKDEDVAKRLAELENIGKVLDEQKFGYNARIIKELREAGVTGEKSFALWLKCMEDVEFDQRGRSNSEFSEWKKRQVKEASHEKEAEYQLLVQWLSIVLMDCNARTDSGRNEAVNAAVSFVDTVVERLKKNDGRLGGAADDNVMSSVLARHYKLDTTATRRENGAYVAADVGGIYEKMILPFYRSTNQAANLMNAWTRRIDQETAIADSLKGDGPKQKFKTERLPELQWGKARDLFKLGQEETAVPAMMNIIKTHTEHRRASGWITELTALLKKDDAKKESSPAAAPPEAAPAEKPVASTPAPAPAPVPEPAETATTDKGPRGGTGPAVRPGPPGAGRR